jgi:ubiquinone/menaquinone biosynthesis C-methylase UbiE
MSHADSPIYVCGHTPRELLRLASQGTFYLDITRHVLQSAGLSTGMRVVDIGCGAGDLSLLVAHIVGTSGAVLGVDRSPEAIAAAKARVQRHGLPHLDFQVTNIESAQPPWPADALVGRFVLMHQANPAETLRQASRFVRSGGLVVLLESQMVASVPETHSWPSNATYDIVLRWMVDVMRAAGAYPDMGFRLRQVFLDAGLPAPELCIQARADGGVDAPTYAYIAESVRSILPLAETNGIACPIPPEEIEERLREETIKSGGILVSHFIVGAWCRVE